MVRVRILTEGFEFEGTIYPSLSAAFQRWKGAKDAEAIRTQKKGTDPHQPNTLAEHHLVEDCPVARAHYLKPLPVWSKNSAEQ